MPGGAGVSDFVLALEVRRVSDFVLDPEFRPAVETSQVEGRK